MDDTQGSAPMSPDETLSVTVRWTETSLGNCGEYGVSENALSALLATNPTCGLPRDDIKHLRCLPWASSKAGKTTELLTVWYIYVPDANRVEIIAISEPSDTVSDREKNAADASSTSKKIVARVRDGYLGYRVIREIVDHWHDITSFL
jgi:hypothetical protein